MALASPVPLLQPRLQVECALEFKPDVLDYVENVAMEICEVLPQLPEPFESQVFALSAESSTA